MEIMFFKVIKEVTNDKEAYLFKFLVQAGVVVCTAGREKSSLLHTTEDSLNIWVIL